MTNSKSTQKCEKDSLCCLFQKSKVIYISWNTFHSQNSVNIKYFLNGHMAIWITFFKCQVAVMKHSEHVPIFCLWLQIWHKHLRMHQPKINVKIFLGTVGHFF